MTPLAILSAAIFGAALGVALYALADAARSLPLILSALAGDHTETTDAR